MAPQCPDCGERMSLIDETTKLVEYRCANCHHREIEWKSDEVEGAEDGGGG